MLFRAICTSSKTTLSYKTCLFHRVIDEFMIQGGDITAGDGTGGDSIYGGEFEDENLNWRQVDTEGLLCMANRGKDTNSRQDVLGRMAKIDVDNDDRPLTPLLIAHCGELERRKKQTQPPASTKPGLSAIKDTDHDRGRRKRRRTSTSSSGSRSSASSMAHLKVKQSKRDRRRSDHSLDSTLRGRALKRGATDSISPVLEEEDEGRRKKQKHKKHVRGASPSRGSEGEKQGRRRSSLPNQDYHDRPGERKGEGRTDEKRGREQEWTKRDDRDFGVGRRTHRDRGSEWSRDEDVRNRGREVESEDMRQGYSGRDRRFDRGSRWQDEGRLGGPSEEASEGGIRFKGRGSMKYREKW
ncbi:MAG: hypothetical protein Q9165_008605 [Trypethelium subeluteriae]